MCVVIKKPLRLYLLFTVAYKELKMAFKNTHLGLKKKKTHLIIYYIVIMCPN